MSNYKLLQLFFLISLLTVNTAHSSKVVDFNQFKNQVIENNHQLKALKSQIDSFSKKQKEANLIFAPHLFANFFYSQDERETLNPQFMGVDTTVKNYEFGLKQQTAWGQQLSLSYQAQYIGLNGTLLANPVAYEVGPKIELSQSLWKNFFGEETRASQQLIASQNYYSYYQDVFNYQQLLNHAKLIYIQTYIAKESLKLQKESLKRAQEILSWAKRRSQRQLADESDYLQAQAQVLSKEFEVRTALDNFSTISKKYLSLQGSSEFDLNVDLQPIDSSELLNYQPSHDYQIRSDVEAYKEQLNVYKYQSLISAHRYKPTLELFGQLHYQGREPEYSPASDEAWDRKNEWWVIGLKFLAPLYFFDAKSAIDAYEIQQLSAEQQLLQKEKEALSDWQSLKEQLMQTKEKLLISKKLLAVQKKKIDVERNRLKQGRTTTYQVLMFEIDYLNAELIQLKSLADLVQVTTQLDLYKKNYHE